MSTVLKRVKLVGGIIVGAGVSMVVGNLIKSTTPVNPKLLGKAFAWIGATAVTIFAGALAEKTFSDKFDEVIEHIREAVMIDVHAE